MGLITAIFAAFSVSVFLADPHPIAGGMAAFAFFAFLHFELGA